MGMATSLPSFPHLWEAAGQGGEVWGQRPEWTPHLIWLQLILELLAETAVEWAQHITLPCSPAPRGGSLGRSKLQRPLKEKRRLGFQLCSPFHPSHILLPLAFLGFSPDGCSEAGLLQLHTYPCFAFCMLLAAQSEAH